MRIPACLPTRLWESKSYDPSEILHAIMQICYLFVNEYTIYAAGDEAKSAKSYKDMNLSSVDRSSVDFFSMAAKALFPTLPS